MVDEKAGLLKEVDSEFHQVDEKAGVRAGKQYVVKVLPDEIAEREEVLQVVVYRGLGKKWGVTPAEG